MVIIFLIGQESGNTTKKSAGMREKPSKWNAVSANYIALDWLLQRTLSLNEFIIICERRPHRNTISVPSAPFHDRGRGVGGATKRERYNPSRPPYHHFSDLRHSSLHGLPRYVLLGSTLSAHATPCRIAGVKSHGSASAIPVSNSMRSPFNSLQHHM